MPSALTIIVATADAARFAEEQGDTLMLNLWRAKLVVLEEVLRVTGA